ncbi:hypothetical protein BDW74DRAFT_179302 [Aspergillus multicolor]|uniref:uncharacterized protein n=1 Tax=Aspergillus multicolor TaxID=41759 RepID=UPI003CCD8233
MSNNKGNNYIGDIEKPVLLRALWHHATPLSLFGSETAYNEEEALRQAEQQKWNIDELLGMNIKACLRNDYALRVEYHHHNSRKFHEVIEDLRAGGHATRVPRRRSPPNPQWYIGDLDKGDLLYALWHNSIPNTYAGSQVQFDSEEALRQANKEGAAMARPGATATDPPAGQTLPPNEPSPGLCYCYCSGY